MSSPSLAHASLAGSPSPPRSPTRGTAMIAHYVATHKDVVADEEIDATAAAVGSMSPYVMEDPRKYARSMAGVANAAANRFAELQDSTGELLARNDML